MNNAQISPELLQASRTEAEKTHSPKVAKEKRATALRTARDEKQTFSAEDQKRAASNLHNLLEEVCHHGGVSKRDVVIKAGLGGGEATDSTKRLDTYTLPEDAGETRRLRLAKKPGKYFEIAEAIAELLNEHSAPFICQVFEGCSFGQGQEFLTRWEEERWSRLAHQLQGMTFAVSNHVHAEVYWVEAANGNGRYDQKSDRIAPAPQPMDQVGCSAGLAGYQAHPSELPPIPSVLLGARPLATELPATVRFDDGSEVSAKAIIALEVRLALAPVGRTGVPGPLLEFRSALSVFDEREGSHIVAGAYFDELEDGLQIVGAANVDQSRSPVQVTIPELPEAEYREGCRNDYWAWEEISGGLLQEVFGNWEAPLQMAYAQSGANPDDEVASRFEAGTSAFFLDAHLLKGPLDRELIEACKSRTALLDAFRDAQSAEILKSEADAESRWRNL